MFPLLIRSYLVHILLNFEVGVLNNSFKYSSIKIEISHCFNTLSIH